MALEYTDTDKISTNAFAKLLVHAPSGYGKTTLFATMPGNKVLISPERGELSLSPANQTKLFGKADNIYVVRISSASDLGEAYSLIAGTWGANFQSVGLDSISDIAQTVLSIQLGSNKDPRKAYGNMQETMSKYIRLFRDLPNKHVYFTAKQGREIDAEGHVSFAPSMPGKALTLDLPHYFDEVLALQISATDPQTGKSKRFLRTQPDAQYLAKDRSGMLAEIEEPNLSAIIAKIQNKPVS